MRFTVELSIDQSELKSDYRRCIISLLKSALTSYENGKYYEQFFKQGVKQKSYSWAVFFEKPQFTKDKITLEGTNVRLILATGDRSEGLIFYNSLMSVKGKKIHVGDGIHLVVKRMQLQREKMVTGEVAWFKILSPVVYREHHREGNRDDYFSVADEHFLPMLKETLKKQLADYDGRLVKLVDDLVVDISRCRKTVVNHYGCGIGCTIGYIGFKGDPRLLDALQITGLGVRQNSGFGLIELQPDLKGGE